MYFPRLRDLREDADLTQAQVAKLLFTSQTVYSRYERGALTIPVEHLLILADRYGVSSIPCVVVFKNGEETDRSVGLRPKEALKAMLEA